LSSGLEIIFDSIDELSSQSADKISVVKSEETKLFGAEGIDSLDLVNLVISIESRVQALRGEPIVLVDENTMGLDPNPFSTIGSLATYIDSILADT